MVVIGAIVCSFPCKGRSWSGPLGVVDAVIVLAWRRFSSNCSRLGSTSTDAPLQGLLDDTVQAISHESGLVHFPTNQCHFDVLPMNVDSNPSPPPRHRRSFVAFVCTASHLFAFPNGTSNIEPNRISNRTEPNRSRGRASSWTASACGRSTR